MFPLRNKYVNNRLIMMKFPFINGKMMVYYTERHCLVCGMAFYAVFETAETVRFALAAA